MVGGLEMRRCTSLAPALRTICTIFTEVVPRTIVVDQHDALALQSSRIGVVLQADAEQPYVLRRLDEGTAVVVANDAELERNARLLA